LLAEEKPLGGIQAEQTKLENHLCLQGHGAFTKTLEKLQASLKTANRLSGQDPW
jgi:hypothetical protein